MIDLDAWWQEAHRVAKPRAAIVCTGSQPFTSRLIMSNIERFRYEWVWCKPQGSDFLNANRKPLEAHENIMIFYEARPTYNAQFSKGDPYCVIRGALDRVGLQQPDAANDTVTISNGDRYPLTWQKFNQEKGDHPTQKPVALFEYLIRTYTQPGDLVVDPFVGSGTTAIAARNTGRRFICGDNGTDEKTGKTWAEIARARLAEPYTISMFDTPPAQAETPTQREMFAKTENPAEAG